MIHRSKQRGSLVVETALVGSIFIMMILGVMDFGRIYYCRSTLKYAVSQGARFATTGGVLEDADNNALSREDSIIYMIRQLAGFSDLVPEDIDVTAVTSGGASVAGPGGPGDVVTVRAAYRVEVISPYLYHFFDHGIYQFEALTSFRNEEYPEA